MLNKNLLLGCMIATLAACGGQGSVDLGPKNPDFGKEPPPVVTPPPTDTKWTWDFEDEAQVNDWKTGSALAAAAPNQGNDCNLETTISRHFQATALQITPVTGWKADFEDMCAMGFVKTPVALQGGKVKISVFLPTYYTNQNPWNTDADPLSIEDDRFNFGIQVLLEDASGNRAEAAGWKNVYELLGSKQNANGIGHQQRDPDPTSGEIPGRWFDMTFNADSYGAPDAGFDINAVVGVGIRITLRDTNVTLPWEDNAQYVFIDNVALTPPGDGYVPPVIPNPSQPPVDFALPVFVDGVESGFSDTWSGWGGTYSWGESIAVEFDGSGNSGLQIGGPSPAPDVSGYSNFHFSVFGAKGSGTTALEVSLCDCDGASVEVEVIGDEWNDFTIPVADFANTSLGAIRIQSRGTEPLTYYVDNIGFDLVTGGPGGPAPLSRGWATSSEEVSVGYGSVSFSPTDEVQLFYPLPGPVDLSGGTVTFTISADQTYIDSGASVQPFVQETHGDWVGHWSCWINSDQLSTAGTQYECAIPEGFGADEGQQIRIGVGSKGSSIAGTLIVSGVSVALAGDAADPAVPLTKGWGLSDDTLTVTYGERVSFSPTAEQQLFYTVDGPVDLSGATIVFDIIANQAYLDSGASLQPFVQEAHGDWIGHWSCWINSDQLSTAGIQYECAIPEGFNADEGQQIRIGVGSKGSTVVGTITLTNVNVVLAVNLLPINQGWATSSEEVSVGYGSVSFSPTDEVQLFYPLPGPVDLSGGTVTFTISADQTYIDSGASVQPFVQETHGDWVGHWSCWINSDQLSTAGTQYECAIPEGFGADEGQQIRIGVGSKGSSIAGTLIVSGVSVALAGDAADPAVPLTKGWGLSDDTLTVTYGERVSFSPTAEQQLFYTVDGPVDLSGATIVFDIIANQAYLDSGASLQPFVQEAHGDWIGHWSCWINSDQLSIAGIQYECAIPEGFNADEGQQIRIGVGSKGSTVAGTITLSGVKYVLPAAE
jgi:hypothetical protein